MREITESFRKMFTSRTGRLMMTYLAIIMTLTILFSAIIFVLASSQFDRPVPPHFDSSHEFEPESAREQFDQILSERAVQAKTELLITLALLNFGVLLFASWFSYYLARKTLAPIEEAMEAQSQFVSDASHELRTPLTALQTTNEVALRNKSIRLSDAKKLISHNITETIKLRELTNALLELIEGENADINNKILDLRSVVSDTLQSIIPLAQAKSITIEDEIPELYVMSNAGSLGQVMRILLENAVKYSPKNSVVRVIAYAGVYTVKFDVIDHGLGIAENDLEKIFRRFYQADESRTDSGSRGYGLGLAIAKTICDRQGITLTVVSKLGSGSTFSLEMNRIQPK